MSATTLIALTVALGFLLKFLYSRHFSYWRRLRIPERPSYFVTYNMNKHSVMRWDTDNYNALKGQKIGGFWEMGYPVLYIRDLDLIKTIFVKDFDHFVNRRTFPTDNERDHTKLMLSFRETEDWKSLRNILTPAFSTGRMRRLFTLFSSCAQQYMTYLQSKQSSGPVDFRDAMGKYTMACIAESVFGIDCHAFSDTPTEFFRMGKAYMNFTAGRVFKLMFVSNYPKLCSALRMNVFHQEADSYLTRVVGDVVRSRKDLPLGTGRFNDFLEIMRESNAEEDRRVLSEAEIVAQCMNFFAAGSDSIETVLIWAGWELAKSPEIQDRLAEEVLSVKDLSNFDAVMGLEYLDMFVSETLRKYPPTMRAERRCLKDYRIEGTDFVVPKGLFVHVPIYPIHHDPEYWPEPEKFDPERFSKEGKAAWVHDKVSYMPFGHGPRTCIAGRYSIVETKVCLAHLITHFEISTCSKTEDKPVFFHLSLKPVNGCWLTLKPRKKTL